MAEPGDQSHKAILERNIHTPLRVLMKANTHANFISILFASLGALLSEDSVAAQDVPKPLFHFAFDGHAKDSLGSTMFEAQKSFYSTNPEVKATDAEFVGNAIVNERADQKSYVVRTPSLNYDKFTVVVRVKPLRSSSLETNFVTGGFWLRWFTLFRNDFDKLCVGFNNEDLIEETPLTIESDTWNLIVCGVDLNRKFVRIHVNGNACPEIQLPNDFELLPLSQKWKSKYELNERHWLFDNPGNGRRCQGYIDEFMVFDSLVSPDTAASYFSLLKKARLIIGSDQVIEKRSNDSIAKTKSRIRENLRNAGLPSTNQGLLDYLAQFGSEEEANENIASLIQQLGDKQYQKRISATSLLRLVGIPALGLLEKASTTSREPEVTYRARMLINELTADDFAGPTNSDVLLTYLRDHPSPTVVPYLFLSLAGTKNEATRISICETLVVSIGPQNQDFIKECLRHPDKWVRLAAVCSLPKIKMSESLKDDLEPLSADQDELVGLSAVTLLELHCPELTTRSLNKFLHSEDWKIQTLAQHLTQQISSSRQHDNQAGR